MAFRGLLINKFQRISGLSNTHSIDSMFALIHRRKSSNLEQNVFFGEAND
jgi:hypothetical protein